MLMENIILTRQELFELVWAQPMTVLAKRYDISDVGLRKACLRMNIPIPKAGHWQKVRAGRKIRIPELPLSDSKQEITLQEVDGTKNKKEYPWTQRQLEIESDPKLNLVVPDKLHHPDELIVETKRIFSDKDARGGLNIYVQSSMFQRALRFMDTFIKLLRARGHGIEVTYYETYAIIREQRVKIQLRERLRIVDKTDGSWPTRDFVPTGIMLFKSEGYGGYEWLDGKRKLEEQLSNILAKIETKIDELHECWRQNKIREDERDRLLEIQKEKEQRKQQELRDFKKLLNKSLRWQQVKILRDFIADAEARAVLSQEVSDEFRNWKAWAVKKADWYDPYLESEDELLIDVDKEKLSMPKTAASFED